MHKRETIKKWPIWLALMSFIISCWQNFDIFVSTKEKRGTVRLSHQSYVDPTDTNKELFYERFSSTYVKKYFK